MITSNPALIRCTRLGKFALQQRAEESEPGLLMRWARKFRPKGGHGEGQRQMAMLRNLGKIMKHIPGKARDLHGYIAVHDYWMNGSPENLKRMLCLLIDRYAPGYGGRLPQQDAIHYPDAAIYHPDAPAPFPDLASYRKWRVEARRQGDKETRRLANARPLSPSLPVSLSGGVVGILSLRTVILSGNTAHLDALVRAIEARGIEARVAYSSGLDMRPAIEQFFRQGRGSGFRVQQTGRQPGVFPNPEPRTPEP